MNDEVRAKLDAISGKAKRPKPKSAGRPFKEPTDRRVHRMQIRLTQEELSEIERRATTMSMDVSNYARLCMLGHVEFKATPIGAK